MAAKKLDNETLIDLLEIMIKGNRLRDITLGL